MPKSCDMAQMPNIVCLLRYKRERDRDMEEEEEAYERRKLEKKIREKEIAYQEV